MLPLFAALLSAVVFGLLIALGLDYITIGYGLNPYLAFPLALFFTAAAFSQVHSFLIERRLAREYKEDMQARMDEYKSVVFE